ncbi:chorismate-binding protein [Cellulomonas sp. zg-ZUI168]|nr:chorismate-binding protein [Cellulomonas fengjieae]
MGVPEQTGSRRGVAWFAGVEASGVLEVVDVRLQPERLVTPGWWAVVGDFEGRVRAWRFADVAASAPAAPGPWVGPSPEAWTSSLDRAQYVAAVERVRAHIEEGDVYQANVCRMLSAPLAGEPDARALGAVLDAGNPAPYSGGVHVPGEAWVVSASPELYLRIADGIVTSGPIKGTAATAEAMTDKDRAENIMITDLVRNDLQRVCAPGTVEVTTLLGEEHHPGLVHLVSTVQGVLAEDVASAPDLWARLLDATYPPGSVSGAPKSSALDVIDALEPVARGPYCGAVGWVEVAVDGSVRAELAVGIRTFWWADDVLRFGTGAGITWGSDAQSEWAETALKAARLVALASGGDAGLVTD